MMTYVIYKGRGNMLGYKCILSRRGLYGDYKISVLRPPRFFYTYLRGKRMGGKDYNEAAKDRLIVATATPAQRAKGMFFDDRKAWDIVSLSAFGPFFRAK